MFETFAGDGYVYVIDCGDGFTGAYLSPNSSSCTINRYSFVFVKQIIKWFKKRSEGLPWWRSG